jgi:RNA-directed DNA polymerase
MKDRAMQALHLLALQPVAEMTADWNSYGFRPERSTHDAIGQVFTMLARKSGAEWILEGDIKGCFDHISHEWMLKNICTDTKVLEKWLKAGVIDKGVFSPTSEGTPQGGIISPTLANIVLDGIEAALARRYPPTTNAGRKAKVNFVRYADDFVITGASKEMLENEVKPMVRDFLAERGLTLSEEKTRVTHISEGFDFLGQNVRRYSFGKPNSKLLIKPATRNVRAFLDRVREVVRLNRAAKQENLIGVLNPMIRGWCNYHRHIVAAELFGKVDHLIWDLLRSWSNRRHSNKSAGWIRNRYWGRIEDRQEFRCYAVGREGKIRTLCLRLCRDTVIERHVKIQGEATPFDLRFETYFEDRLSVRMEKDLRGRRRLLYLWKQQNGLCPVCGEKITKLTKWHLHHMVRRVDGGSDASSNLAMLHPNCHRQHHANPHLKWKLPVGYKNPT